MIIWHGNKELAKSYMHTEDIMISFTRMVSLPSPQASKCSPKTVRGSLPQVSLRNSKFSNNYPILTNLNSRGVTKGKTALTNKENLTIQSLLGGNTRCRAYTETPWISFHKHPNKPMHQNQRSRLPKTEQNQQLTKDLNTEA